MSEFNHESPFQSAYSTAHSPPSMQPPGPDTLPPMNSNFDYPSDWQLYRSYLEAEVVYHPNYYNVYGSLYPPPGFASPRNGGLWDSSAGMYRPRLPLPSMYSDHTQDSLSAEFSGYPALNRTRPVGMGQQTPMPQHAAPNFSPPSMPQWYMQPHGHHHQIDLSIPPAASQVPNANDSGSNTMRHANTNETASARTNPGNMQFHRPFDPPSHGNIGGHGNIYQRPQLPLSQVAGAPGRTTPHLVALPTRRTDGSSTPRTSHRRSFDRYSIDLSQSNTSSDDAARTPTHRSRRPRTMMGHRTGIAGFYARQLAHYHPNVPSDSQLQHLKDSLKKQVRSELAEDVSPTCDICQKDYSDKVVQPTEAEEVAVELACKHVFGEHCMHTWFATCKAHKNKLTCPMCRTLLIEPLRRKEEMLDMVARGEQAALESLLRSRDQHAHG
ncbi:hypothetical protein CC80DRAFT_541995 [Byssothecium circinans]|uniref:RING-type domain-containing protein n=1 Tax=Byssothecium circinans TaxID=147558 RepID=A0A6A5UDL9_9PLEO|nr:hypothetical protein CC80DRAFT_541995 [Byssothecium circinans]